MMDLRRSVAAGAFLLASACLTACGDPDTPATPNNAAAETNNSTTSETPNAASRWELLSSGEGTALRLVGAGGAPTIHLFCPTRAGQLVVNVASFKPIASEERLSFGAGGEVVALVADARGDALRGGVTGEGSVPGELAKILGGPISVSYGAQRVGSLSAPDEADRTAFLSACGEKASAPVPPKPAQPAAACRMQDGDRLTMTPLRAIGTEPFWGARIEGRCVTYSTPEDQAGTRIWTKFNPGPDGGIWSGALDGRQFELRTRPAPPPGCSDGMSDNRYPFSVTLRVRGETRIGCAKPA